MAKYRSIVLTGCNGDYGALNRPINRLGTGYRVTYCIIIGAVSIAKIFVLWKIFR